MAQFLPKTIEARDLLLTELPKLGFVAMPNPLPGLSKNLRIYDPRMPEDDIKITLATFKILGP